MNSPVAVPLLGLGLLGLGLLGCTPPPPIDTSSRDPRQTVQQACRDAATRVLVRQDRGALLREDVASARTGTDDYLQNPRLRNDQLGRSWELGQLTDRCTRENLAPGTRGPVQGTPIPGPPIGASGGAG